MVELRAPQLGPIFHALSDGTRLNYTLTRPSAEGRFPVALKYDPYGAGTASDPKSTATTCVECY